MENMNLGQLTEELFQGFAVDSNAMINAVRNGNMLEAVKLLGDAVLDTMGQPLEHIKEYFLALLAVGIGAALLKQLELFFKDSQVQKISFWIVYLILAKYLLTLYYNGEMVAKECLEKLIDFGHVFIPVFSIVLTAASGSITGVGYIATLTIIIYVIEQFLLVIMIPMVEGYMLFSLLGALWQKERVEKLMELLEKAISLGFKGMLVGITGFGLLQSMILPYVDHTKVGVVKNMVEMIPGVGKVAGNTLEMLGGSAVLLKNGVGVIGMLLLLLVAAVPLIKIGLIYLVMKLAAVVYGLFGEKQMIWCADKLGQAEIYMLKITGAGLLLFLLWIVLAIYTTNQKVMF